MTQSFESLKKRKDFLDLREKCSCYKTKNFIINFKTDTYLSKPKIGITVSNKIGNAVKRNYIKRVVKSTINDLKQTFPKNLVIEVIAKKNLSTNFTHLRKDLVNFQENYKSL